MIFLAMDFHYVEKNKKYKRGIYPVSLKNFSKQLDEIGKKFKFISQADLLNALDGKQSLPEMSCMITFDDGISSQYENALPILKKKGIPAIFFVSSLPYVEKKACLVHKIHWIRAHLSSNKFFALVSGELKKIGKDINDLLTPEREAQAILKYRYDNKYDAKIKFLLNGVLKDGDREKIVDNIFEKIVPDEAKFCEKFYIKEKQIKELGKLGFLGLHSYRHYSLSKLSAKSLKEDLLKNKNHLERLTGTKMKSISYTYGNEVDINKRVVKACRELGLKFAFTKERAFNASLKNPLLFARADTNDVIGGKKPVFGFKSNGQIEIFGKFSFKRRVFFKE